jgi:hypothetical protein
MAPSTPPGAGGPAGSAVDHGNPADGPVDADATGAGTTVDTDGGGGVVVAVAVGLDGA